MKKENGTKEEQLFDSTIRPRWDEIWYHIFKMKTLFTQNSKFGSRENTKAERKKWLLSKIYGIIFEEFFKPELLKRKKWYHIFGRLFPH